MLDIGEHNRLDLHRSVLRLEILILLYWHMYTTSSKTTGGVLKLNKLVTHK